MAYASWSVIFGEQPSAAKWNILGTNDAYFDSLIGSGAASTSYTPTFTNVTTGNGTISGAYTKFGKIVFFRARFLFGSTSAFTATVAISLPVTSISYTTGYSKSIGQVVCYDTSAGPSLFPGHASWTSTTTCEPDVWTATGTYAQVSNIISNQPFTWATGDILDVEGRYEAA